MFTYHHGQIAINPYPIADIVLKHHERIDGSGYPQGANYMSEAKPPSMSEI